MFAYNRVEMKIVCLHRQNDTNVYLKLCHQTHPLPKKKETSQSERFDSCPCVNVIRSQ